MREMRLTPAGILRSGVALPLAFSLAIAPACSMAQTSAVTVQVTADNNYGLYLGIPSVLRLVGGDSDWRTIESFSTSASSGEYAFIAAWDLGGFQGLQASAVVTAGAAFPTSATDWVYTVISPSSLPGWSAMGNALPSTGSLQTALNSALWSTVGAAAPGTAAPWNMTSPIPSAQWIWSDSLGEVSASDGQLVVFRTSSALISVVPEPAPMYTLIAGLSLGMLFWRRRCFRTRMT